jgi:hypothetical protein
MENLSIFEDQNGIEQVMIYNSDGSVIGMTKAEYDRRQEELESFEPWQPEEPAE